MKVTKLIWLSLLVVSPHVHADQPTCVEAFSLATPADETVADALGSLAKLRIAIDTSKVRGSGDSIASLEQDYKKKEAEIFARLKAVGQSEVLTRKILREQIKQLQTVIRTASVNPNPSKQKEFEDKVSSYQPVDPAKVQFERVVTEPPGKINEKLNSFELGVTPVTQFVWRRVIRAAMKRYGGGLGLFAAVPQEPAQFKNDLNPVESISYTDVKFWLQALNGLARKNDPILNECFPGHQPGDTYRLPTPAEYTFVTSSQNKPGDNYPVDQNELSNYAWTIENSGQTTHAVAVKFPIRVGRAEFYDLLGNVWQFVSDTKDVKKGQAVSVRGGSYKTEANSLHLILEVLPDARDSTIGVRLVRVPAVK